MSGGGGSLKVERRKRGKASKRKKLKRVGFVLDMTPLVDITFLLLTFFMFTTTMATPQVMDMRLPPDMKTKKEAPCDSMLSIFVRKDMKIFWQGSCDTTKYDSVKIDSLQKLVVRRNLEPGKENKVLTVLRISDSVSYEYAIKVLDMINLAEYDICGTIERDKDPEGKPLKQRKQKFALLPLKDWKAKILEDQP
ncbi:MAG: biopolymer transporter ExbD [Candidatus Kapabacteria bacterium]|nr:biopolymer transporter ExbD [Candidatus Kapabacteria bacterium]